MDRTCRRWDAWNTWTGLDVACIGMGQWPDGTVLGWDSGGDGPWMGFADRMLGLDVPRGRRALDAHTHTHETYGWDARTDFADRQDVRTGLRQGVWLALCCCRSCSGAFGSSGLRCAVLRSLYLLRAEDPVVSAAAEACTGVHLCPLQSTSIYIAS